MIKKTILVFLCLLGVVETANALEGDPVAGKAKIAVCSACHTPTGNSVITNYPKLAGQGERYLIKQITDIKEGRRKVLEMTGMVDNLSDQDIADIAAYFSKQKMTTGDADPELAKKGEAIFRGGDFSRGVTACTGCHSPIGAGNSLAGFPRLAGQHSEYITKQLVDFREGNRTNDGDTMIMRSTAEKLSNKQIDALASYLNGLY